MTFDAPSVHPLGGVIVPKVVLWSTISTRAIRTLVDAGADPKLKARYAELGSAVFPTTPADLGKLFVTDTEKWAKVVKFSGAKAE